MAKLVVQQPDGTMRDVTLDRDRITIGRRPDNDLCLPYPAVSAEHAEIITVVADSFLHDLGSTNGTLVNGTRVTKHFLRDRDRIDIGRQQLVYLTDESATIDPLPAEDLDAQAQRDPASAPEVSEEHASASAPNARAPGENGHFPDLSRAAADDLDRAPPSAQAADAASEPRTAPADDLLAELMEMDSDASVAVDMPPTISVVPPVRRVAERWSAPERRAAGGAYVEVMNGPNAGQKTPMTKPEFVLGKGGVTVAIIRQDDAGYRLVPVDGDAPSLNGRAIEAQGARLAFGDTIDVAGVMLRFGRRTPA